MLKEYTQPQRNLKIEPAKFNASECNLRLVFCKDPALTKAFKAHGGGTQGFIVAVVAEGTQQVGKFTCGARF